MTIVCATDFSKSCEAALSAAAAIAARTQEELVLAHALDFLDESLGELDLDRARTQAERALAEAADRLAQRAGRPVRSVLLYGPAAEALPEFAELRGVSLVIVASEGHGAKPFRRLGGTSERLARDLPRPLLVVRDPAPFEAWARGERPLKVLLGVDRTSDWESSLRWVNRLRGAGPCDLTIARVYDAHEERARLGLPRAHALTERDAALEAQVESDLASRVVVQGQGSIRYKAVLGVGRLGDHLVELAGAEGIELIALGSHRQAGLARFASVASVSLHYAHASVLLVPPSLGAPEVRPPSRVLVATDLSPLSNAAVGHAFALVEGRPDAEVVLLYVDQHLGETPTVHPEDGLRQLVPEGRAAMTRLVVVKDADPAKAICTEAERAGADVICMGSHGRSGIVRAVLGSVAERVVRESLRPVLLVRSAGA